MKHTKASKYSPIWQQKPQITNKKNFYIISGLNVTHPEITSEKWIKRIITVFLNVHKLKTRYNHFQNVHTFWMILMVHTQLPMNLFLVPFMEKSIWCRYFWKLKTKEITKKKSSTTWGKNLLGPLHIWVHLSWCDRYICTLVFGFCQFVIQYKLVFSTMEPRAEN